MTFKKILVNIDAVRSEHPALDQAMELAGKMSAAVTIVDVLPDVPDRARQFVTDRIEQELVDHRWDLLRTLAATRGAGIGTAVVRGKAPAISLVREVLREGFDLLIRSHGSRDDLARPYGPIDMQLLRKCPCPVWLAGPSARPKPRRILAAIDAGCNDPGEAELNSAILDLAMTIRDLEQAHLTVVYAWSPFGYEFLQRRMSPNDLTAFEDAARSTARQDLARAIDTAGAAGRPGVEALFLEGDPQQVLREHAESHDIDLVVMGSVARTGIAGFVMGNTAERILSQLRGSVVAIKPAGFASPVSLDR
jgi:nucleotide-binding universal stress UspA family protein